MKHSLLILLILINVLFIGCNENQKENEHTNKSIITINTIEQNITNKKTSFGCHNKENNASEECTQEEMDSAKFILSTLNKDSNNEKKSNIGSIKKRLNLSLKEIGEEVDKKRKLKDDLEALVNELNDNKKKKLEDFVNQINNSTFNNIEENREETSSHKISTIKSELQKLISTENIKVKPKVVKKRLERLITNVSESKNDLLQIETNLKILVKEAEEKNTSSIKKFTSAIIEDVSSKKISIIDGDEQFLIVKVQKGENLSLLAKRYYNDAGKYKLIYEANKDKISSEYEIYPNSELIIPKI